MGEDVVLSKRKRDEEEEGVAADVAPESNVEAEVEAEGDPGAAVVIAG